MTWQAPFRSVDLTGAIIGVYRALCKNEKRTELNFLKPFDTVYHFNGQQQVMINGDHATGTSYCLVTLTGFEKGKKVKTTIGVIYLDDAQCVFLRVVPLNRY